MKPTRDAIGLAFMRILTSFAAVLSILSSPSIARTPRTDTTAAGEQELAKLLAGATPGKPTSCLSSFQRRDSRNISGVGVVYRDGRTFWLNRFQDGCPELNYHSIIVTRTPSDQLCRGDISTIVDNSSGFFEGSCVMGDFVPYTKPSSK